MIAELNKATGNASEPYTRTSEGMRCNVGNYHLSCAYGGVALHQLSNDRGGVRDISGKGHVPKRELKDFLDGFLQGMETVKQL